MKTINLKNKFSLYIIGVIALTITSCDVDRLPETAIADPSYWQNENDLKAATNYLYTYLPGLPETSDVWSDDAFGTASNNISDGSRITPSSDSYYSDQYNLIRAANNIIEKSTRVIEAGVDVNTVNWYVSEAKFYRAWGYFNLVRRYGAVPLILKTLVENSPELQAPKASREEIFNSIYDDLDFAANNLRTPSLLGESNYGRISSTAANAFKSRVALFEGTRAKFHGYGDSKKHLMLAKSAAKKVIDSKEHSIYPNYFDLFQYEGEGIQNKENILVRQYGKSIEESISSHTTQRTLETGAVNPTKALADSYLMSDGLPINISSNYKFPKSTLEVFENRDPRMSATFFKKGDSYTGTQPVFNVPSLSFQRTGFANRRYANIQDWQNSRSYIDRTLIRYAEVLLNYAEAAYELNETISDDDIDISINQLRNRETVNMPELSNNFINSNQLDMREEIRRERRVELALEGFRYWDIIRWKTAEIELPKTVLGNFFFEEEFGEVVKPELTSENYIIIQKSDTRNFDPGKDYLWPIPTNQISLNPNLEQNPKW
ncbi:RagB/SusD family nutrient uptake outer membrane protein [Joostella sp.]|uniref:RagB/SusD family nutrient uptake outer membrane protein n=1 Tax=Joostella sp. TaxID=2231138 RepID=UPI003A8F2353